jgi:dephospho-CoA kinase
MTLHIGLTGGIACGKSEAGSRIQAHGIPYLDTDQVAHEVMMPGTKVYAEVVKHFGKGILDDQDQISRPSLAKIVFSDPSALQDLNRLVHPEVGRRWRFWMSQQTGPVAVVAIPLLVETGTQKEFDHILCISSTESLMMERLQNRGNTPDQARSRIQSQLPLVEKEKHATWIINNNGSLADFHQQVDRWIATILSRENS